MTSFTQYIGAFGLRWRIQKEGEQVTFTLVDNRHAEITYTCKDEQSEVRAAYDFVFLKSQKLALLDR